MLTLPSPNRTSQLTTFDRHIGHKTMAVPRGEVTEIAAVSGSGFLAKLWMTFPGWFWPHWDPFTAVNQRILKTLILRIYFDDAAEPQVVAPVGDFFGNGLCEMVSFTSEFIGMSSGGFYCSLPMPYRSGFRIEMENRDSEVDTEVFLNAIYQSVSGLPDEVPYFHAQFVTGRSAGPGRFGFAAVRGSGKYVGCTLSCQGEPKNYLSYLEAPEYMYVDEDWDAPRIVGTGLEDYFLGGWYFREGPFVGPHHGVPAKDAFRSATAMYRFHVLDAVHFNQRFSMTFESPWESSKLKPFAYSGVAFYYLRELVAAPQVPGPEDLMVWYRVRDSDHQAIP